MSIEAAIRNGIAFLRRTQRSDGSFPAYASADDDFNFIVEHPSPFMTALVVRFAGDCLTAKGQKKAVRYLGGQADGKGSINYWERGAWEFHAHPCPDDLDDVACSAHAAAMCGLPLSGSDLGKFARLLIFCETKPGGPYRTWVAPKNLQGWQGVDACVNANIAAALGAMGSRLEPLDAYLEAQAKKECLESEFYPGKLIPLFLVSCAVKIPSKAMEFVRAKASEECSPVEASLCLAMLLEAGEKGPITDALAARLAESQREGHWPAEAFFIERSPYMGGSDALTTALCLRALRLYSRLRAKLPSGTSAFSAAEEAFVADVLKLAKARFTTLPPALSDDATRLLSSFLAAEDGKAVALVPFRFSKALLDSHGSRERLEVEAGFATALGWASYTLLDDQYDGEGNLALLPLSVFLNRELASAYFRMLPGTALFDVFISVMSSLDAASAWELRHARFAPDVPSALPDWGSFDILADRSFGHALGPLALLLAAGHGEESRAVTEVKAGFRSYLIARQLTDDMHDWQEDLAKGILTAVNTAVLKEARKVSMQGMPLKLVFWQKSAVPFAREIIKQSRAARRAFLAAGIFKDGALPLEGELLKFERAARYCLSERRKTLDFISAAAD